MTDEEKDKQEFAEWWITYWDIPKSMFTKDHCERAYLEAKRRNRERIERLEKENKRLADRDGNATIELVFPTFDRILLKVVDFGVADNIYVVESDVINARIMEAGDGMETVGRP